MHPLERDILALCQAHSLLAPGERLVVGVSGGPDSIALLRVLHVLGQELDLTLTVAHLDHGLRPEAGPVEESLVRRAAAELGIDCLARRVDTAAHAQRYGLSLEEAARDLRYAFFEEARAASRADKIAVGHTADDQAEEVLLRLIRGAGRRGLSGMPLLRDDFLIRPFLEVEKRRLLSYLKALGAEFVLDPSNTDRRYLRNRIRHELIPYLGEFNRHIGRTLRQEAEILRAEDELLDTQTQNNYHLMVREEKRHGAPAAILDCGELLAQPLAIQRRVVERMLILLGQRPGFRQIQALISQAKSPGQGRLHLPWGLRVSKQSREIVCHYPRGRRRSRGEDNKNLIFRCLLPGPGRYPIPEAGVEITVQTLPNPPDANELRRGEADFLDARQAAFPLVARNRRPGDSFHPLHGPGRRKVADFLTDRKLSPSEKARVPVLTSEGRIVALVGQRIAHEARVTDTTRQIVKICLRPA